MKILWFTSTPSLYDQGKHSYHGGGWIESLEQLVSNDDDIELGVSFFHATDSQKVKQGKTTYYPIIRPSPRKNPIRSIINNWSGCLPDSNFDSALQAIVKDFKPDVIHVFGTEGPFATVQDFTNIPVVIHLQGLINPYLNTYLPVNQSILNFILSPRFFKNNIIGNSPVFALKRFRSQAQREADILQKARYVMGRTDWDKMVSALYNPDVSYFHVDEVLRPSFYAASQDDTATRHKSLTIVSTLSPTVYKGIDVLLRAAKKITELGGAEFRWQVIGLDKNDQLFRHFEATEKIYHADVSIQCLGRKNPEELIDILNAADVFVHPSYIDNSPNSVCEAQMLGLPVIACDVGGVSSLIQHGESGFLVPSNGVFELVHYIKLLAQDQELVENIGERAIKVAKKRHDRIRIMHDLKEMYTRIIN
ncbi:glycosyltransferase family 4 protein [Desulfobacterota bacterium M19]